jgi:hypothetical protein
LGLRMGNERKTYIFPNCFERTTITHREAKNVNVRIWVRAGTQSVKLVAPVPQSYVAYVHCECPFSCHHTKKIRITEKKESKE